MKSFAVFVVSFTFLSLTLLAQSSAYQKPQDKDADKKNAVAAASPGNKKKAAKDEKKEECKGSGQECPPKKEEEKKPGMHADTFSGLKFRSIGPGVESGRVMSIAVNPKKTSEFYVGVASGGVWKTVNDGRRGLHCLMAKDRTRLA